MAHALVTGGAGFIGSHIAETLVNRGDRVRIFDNFSTGSPQNISHFRERLEVCEADLRDSKKVAEAVKGIDVVYHQAALISVPESIQNPAECFSINAAGTVELLEAARLAGVEHVVLASSAAVYGASPSLPLREETRPELLSPYATSKHINENLAATYSNIYGMQVVALRYFNVYGPRQSPYSGYAAAIPRFLTRLQAGQPAEIFGDGQQTRDFVYVSDVVEANLLAAAATGVAGQVFNVCSGVEINLLDLLALLQALFPSAEAPVFSPNRLGDVPRSQGSPDLAAQKLGFRTRVALQAGLKQTVENWQ
jgi:UDP-glucose 4-epimerase